MFNTNDKYSGGPSSVSVFTFDVCYYVNNLCHSMLVVPRWLQTFLVIVIDSRRTGDIDSCEVLVSDIT